jgi:purine-nucleoside phosphorylase
MNDITKNVLSLKESLQAIQNHFGTKTPDVCLVLGSGLKDVVNAFQIEKTLPYSDIPHFPRGHVQGHSGQLHLGKIHDKTVLIFSGRFHHYQGIPNSIAAIPGWISGFWKIPLMISTNASGGISTTYKMGDMALIRDHINMQADHPLHGVMMPEWENPFCDMTTTYEEGLRRSLIQVARQNKINLHQGVYICVPGPSYETPAEIEMFRKMGADMVGMSTIPEVIVARKMGVKIVGISMVANMAAGVGGSEEAIKHTDVVDSIQKTQVKLTTLLSEWLKSLTLLAR